MGRGSVRCLIILSVPYLSNGHAALPAQKPPVLLVHACARLMSRLPTAAMLSVHCGTDALEPYLRDGVSLAVVNRHDRCVARACPKTLKDLPSCSTPKASRRACWLSCTASTRT